MASTWSALKIELLETGANSGTWGTLTNANLGDAVLGEAITGSATVDFASAADVTVTLTDVATTQAARNLRLNITESSTGVGYVGNLILGSGCQIEKFYLVRNNSTGAKTVKNTSGTGISVPAGKSTLVFNDGTNVVDAASYFTSLTLGSALPVASGGTGITSFGTGVATALGVNTGSAGAFVVNGGALGSPSSVGTMPAFTLGGTVSGGGNQINNVIIGTSTPLAGAFTTVDASGAVTLSGGTANGVTYLNGSKVLTSGSALQFDGTKLAILSSSAAVLESIKSTSSTSQAALFQVNNDADVPFNIGVFGSTAGSFGVLGASTPFISTNASTLNFVNTNASGSVVFGIGSSAAEAMRLNGTGLGIGTSSPVSKLEVNGTTTTTNLTTTNSGITLQSGSVTKSSINVASSTNQGVTGTVAGDFYQWTTGGKFLWSSNSGTTAHLVLDGSGNLGLGVTPSANQYGKIFQINQTILNDDNIDSNHLAKNAYYNSGWKYYSTGYASKYTQSVGIHSWSTAASGTAGDPITFTQAMTLDASGRLGIGTTSPLGILHVNGVQDGVAYKNATFSYSGTYYLEVNEQSIRSFNNPLIFGTGTSGTERARITSAGEVLVGKTANDNTSAGVQIYNSSGSTVGRINCIKTASGSASALANYYSGTYVGGIDYTNTATLLVASSDERLKQNIVEAPAALEKVNAIEVVSYDWKHDASSVQYGFVAQRLNTVYPEAVIVGDNNEEIEKTWGVEYGRLTPLLVKAIQEQQAIIETLKARLDAANL